MYVKNGPLTPEVFDTLMAPLGPFLPSFHLAVGVSGGADSMALALLAQEWSVRQGGRMSALTVDHGLRPESAPEAGQVASWLRARGIAHHTLLWEGAKPTRDVQAKARAARYKLLEGWCLREGASHLAVAHHALDQCETFLMRLDHKSGLQGLCGMEPRMVLQGGVVLLRPLLSVHPEDLKATLDARGQSYIQDPSNLDQRFERAQWRGRLNALPETFPETLLSLQNLVRQGWSRFVEEILGKAPLVLGCGYGTCEAPWFFAQTPAAQELVLKRLLTTLGARTYPPSPKAVRALRVALGEGRKVMTLHGCVICISHNHLWVGRELRAAAPSQLLEPGQSYEWDHRFKVEHRGDGRCEVGPLGKIATPGFRSLRPAMPACIWWGLPAVREGGQVLHLADLFESPQVFLTFMPPYGLM